MKIMFPQGSFPSYLMGAFFTLFLTCLPRSGLWAQAYLPSDISDESQSAEEIFYSGDPTSGVSWDEHGALIQGLGEIFTAYEEREGKSSFFKKWPIRLTKVAVQGFLPTAGISLFRPQDPWLKPTIGTKTYMND